MAARWSSKRKNCSNQLTISVHRDLDRQGRQTIRQPPRADIVLLPKLSSNFRHGDRRQKQRSGLRPIGASRALAPIGERTAIVPMLWRTITTGVGPVAARQPRVHDRHMKNEAELVEPQSHSSSRSVSPIASSMMSMPLSRVSSSITMGGLMRRMWPAGIQARPLRKAF